MDDERGGDASSAAAGRSSADDVDRSGEMVEPSRPQTMLTGLLVGAAAYGLGYVVTFVWARSAFRRTLGLQLFEQVAGDSALWKLLGWVFYNAHFVAVRSGGFLAPGPIDLIDALPSLSAGLYVVPPVVLFAAGALVVFATDARSWAVRIEAGSSLLLGYLPLAALGVFLFTVHARGRAIGPETVPAVVVAGGMYPVLFGLAGAVTSGFVLDAARRTRHA